MITKLINTLMPAETRLTQDQLLKENEYLRTALTDEKREGLRLAVRARWVALGVIAILLPIVNTSIEVLYYEFLLLCFVGIGWLQLKAGTIGTSRLELGLIFLDLALLTFALLFPNPFEDPGIPPLFAYHFNNFIYFFVLLASATLAFSWRTVVAYGTWVTVLWLLGLGIMSLQPAAFPGLHEILEKQLGDYSRLADLLNPDVINYGARIQEIVVFYLVALILGLNGWRNMQLLMRQAEATRERSNLARHFSPTMVEQIALSDEPFGQVRSQSVAVLFADIVGFTKQAETLEAEAVVAMLREFHDQLEQAVFEHHGTLDKFLGDGIMATFGTPEPSRHDAGNAIACAKEMTAKIQRLNKARQARGDDAIKLSIGIHYGEVVLGDIGSERRLEYAVLGDVVNVASRLENLTREVQANVIVSEECLSAARAANADPIALEGFIDGGPHEIRGRGEPVHIWQWTKDQQSD